MVRELKDPLLTLKYITQSNHWWDDTEMRQIHLDATGIAGLLAKDSWEGADRFSPPFFKFALSQMTNK